MAQNELSDKIVDDNIDEIMVIDSLGMYKNIYIYHLYTNYEKKKVVFLTYHHYSYFY